MLFFLFSLPPVNPPISANPQTSASELHKIRHFTVLTIILWMLPRPLLKVFLGGCSSCRWGSKAEQERERIPQPLFLLAPWPPLRASRWQNPGKGLKSKELPWSCPHVSESWVTPHWPEEGMGLGPNRNNQLMRGDWVSDIAGWIEEKTHSSSLAQLSERKGFREFSNEFSKRPPFPLQTLPDATLVSVCLSLLQDYSWMLGFIHSPEICHPLF